MTSEPLAAGWGAGGSAYRRAVRALAWALLLLAAAQLGLVLGMEHWWPGLRDREYATHRDRVRARLAEKPDRPLVVVLGSSRTALGFRPDVLPRLPALPRRGGGAAEPVVVNCSLLSAGPVLELVCLRRLLADGIRPDWVLLESWPPFFKQGLADLGRFDPARFGLGDLGVVRRYQPQPADFYCRWLRARAGDWPCVGHALLDNYAPGVIPGEPPSGCGWRELDAWGWLPPPERPDPRQRQAWIDRVHEVYTNVFRDYRISPVADRALREMLTLCRHKGIAVALLIMPESTDLGRWYPPGLRSQTYRYVRDLSRENDVPLLDARDLCPDEDFGDPLHLNCHGAITFTARFGSELLRPLLAGAPAAGTRRGP